jgi:hypothetical protein
MTLQEIKDFALKNGACDAQLDKFVEFIYKGDELSAWQTVLGNYHWLIKYNFPMSFNEIEKLACGIGKIWHEYGYLLEEINYKNGKLNGIYRTWYHDCDRLKSEYTYKDGIIHGLCRNWNDGFGLESEYTYVDGQLNGLYRRWYRNGKLKSEVIYKNNLRDGVYRSWHEYKHGKPNPEIYKYIVFDNGILNGVYLEKSEYGNLISRDYYKNGKKLNKIFGFFRHLHYLYTNK